MVVLAIVSFMMIIISISLQSPELFLIFSFIGIVSIIAAIVKHIQYKKEMPKYEEKPIAPIDPPWEPLSGTFVCSSCGAPTTINREVNPVTACQYCGAELPEIKEMILDRNVRRQKRIDEDLERQKADQREKMSIHLSKRNEYIAMKKHAKAEQTKEVAKATLALGIAVAVIFLAVIIVPLYLLLH